MTKLRIVKDGNLVFHVEDVENTASGTRWRRVYQSLSLNRAQAYIDRQINAAKTEVIREVTF